LPEVAPVPEPIETVRPETPLTAPAPQPPPASPTPERAPPRARSTTAAASSAAGGGGLGSPGAATSGAGAGKVSGRPVYSVQPAPIYPSESRAAHEQGVVILRLTVNAEGRPTAVSIARSSGFARLDRAAVEAGWRCRVSNAGRGMQFEAPIRFDLRGGSQR
jgi:protein TonB